MSKDKISDYSTTANSNTDIGGINVDEGCAPSGINDAIRTLMAQLKTWQSGGQDVYIHPAGSASAPSITANGDTNTGIFFPAADTVGITTGGSERARVDSAGNLGLGVTPSAWSGARALQVGSGAALFDYGSSNVVLGSNLYFDGTNNRYINTDFSSYYQQNNGVHSWGTAASGTAGNAITFTQAMTLDASGNLGIGTTSPFSGSITVARGSGVQASVEIAGNGTTAGSTSLSLIQATDSTAYIYNRSNTALVFGTNNTERARITSSGNFEMYGNNNYVIPSAGSANFRIQAPNVAGTNAYLYLTCTGSNEGGLYYDRATSRLYVYSQSNATGVYLAANGTSWVAVSDERSKDIIEPITNAANKVSTLRSVIGKYKTDEEGTRRSFLIAQDVQAVLPEAVDATDPDNLGVQYTDVIPLLVAAIQEQQAIITQLQADVAALKG